MNFAEKLARPELVDMVAYQSARRGQSGGNIWLNANEASGIGYYELEANGINRYPDFQPKQLIDAYARYANVPSSQVLATRGADEGIDVLIRTFCRSQNDAILICPPTYGMYAISAQTQGCKVIKQPLLTENYQLDLAGLETKVGQVKLVFLCSPNNPTGNLLSRADIEKTIELFSESALVVVDEAYIEFCPEQSVVSWMAKFKNLVILRTLSKAFALAGLRCGFTLANESVIALMSKVIAPYPISAPVAEIATQALSKDGISAMNIRVSEINHIRTDLQQWLEESDWCDEVFDSAANYILFRSTLSNKIFKQLTDNGILIRDQSKQLNLSNCLRISIGSQREIDLVKRILELG